MICLEDDGLDHLDVTELADAQDNLGGQLLAQVDVGYLYIKIVSFVVRHCDRNSCSFSELMLGVIRGKELLRGHKPFVIENGRCQLRVR